jgi:hypothetical protein
LADLDWIDSRQAFLGTEFASLAMGV